MTSHSVRKNKGFQITGKTRPSRASKLLNEIICHDTAMH